MQKKNKKLNTKQNKNGLIVVPHERVVSKIFLIRGKKVMIDKDLAILYGVETKRLNEAVKRNIKRFPEDFMFQLNKQEAEIWVSQIVTPDSRSQFATLDPNLRSQTGTSSLRSQFVILKKGRGQHQKYLPYVFTEQGVAMLSSVLNSERAILVNIQIIRTFTNLREMLATNKELREKIDKLERKYDQNFKIIFQTIQLFLKEEDKPKNKIGFRGRI